MSHLPKPCRLLIIDDNADAAELMQMLLHMEGFDAHAALTGMDGLSRLPLLAPQIVCIDIEIHDVPIKDVIRQIKKLSNFPTPFLVGLTSWDEVNHPDPSVMKEFDKVYLKPVLIEDLVREIRNFCHQ